MEERSRQQLSLESEKAVSERVSLLALSLSLSLSLVDGGAGGAGEESPAGSPLKARVESSGVRAGPPNQGPASHHEGDR